MPNKLSPNKVGLALGGLLGLWHLLWALMVAVGVAQPFIDWVLQLHMVKPFYVILPFSLASTIGLIIMASIAGYVFGYVFGWLWNMVHKK